MTGFVWRLLVVHAHAFKKTTQEPLSQESFPPANFSKKSFTNSSMISLCPSRASLQSFRSIDSVLVLLQWQVTGKQTGLHTKRWSNRIFLAWPYLNFGGPPVMKGNYRSLHSKARSHFQPLPSEWTLIPKNVLQLHGRTPRVFTGAWKFRNPTYILRCTIPMERMARPHQSPMPFLDQQVGYHWRLNQVTKLKSFWYDR